ncbi:MAG: ABC transporter substrate-binding protein [Bacilli bacterium]|nr:ABC transporter substrate-binding protein [Bacilli bacterium]
MKNSKKFLVLAAAGLMTLTSCGGGGQSDPSALTITAVKLGYGLDWLYALTNKYQQKTGQKFNIIEQIGSDGISAIQTELDSHAGSSDIVATRPSQYHKTIYQGQIRANDGEIYPCAYEELTDIYNKEYTGEIGNNTMAKKVDPKYMDFASVDGKIYGVNWANGFVSLVRNLDVWKDFGYTADYYPRTTDEFFEVMDDMNAKIAAEPSKWGETKPMIYCKADEYYSTVVGSWFAQYEGSESIQNFYNGKDPDGRVSKDFYSYDGVEKSLDVLAKIVEFDKSSGTYKYQHGSSDRVSFTQMQNYFFFGAAAFCVNGTWLDIESAAAKEKNLDWMPLPLVSSLTDRLSFKDDATLREAVTFVDAHPTVGDNDGAPAGVSEDDIEIIRDSRTNGSYMRTDFDHIMLVPAWSKKKQAAKDFLHWMYSDEALQIFYDSVGGHHLPAFPSTGSYDTSKTALSKLRVESNKVFSKGLYCPYYMNTQKSKIFSVAGVQSNFSNSVSSVGTCVSWLVDGMTPTQVCLENSNYIEKNWNYIQSCL